MNSFKGTVLYIGGFELPDKNAAAHRVMSNALLLKAMGYKVIFVGVDREHNSNCNIINSKKIIDGFECYSIPYPQNFYQFIKYYLNYKNYINIIKNEKDLNYIIMYNLQSIPMRKIIHYGRSHSIKLIADVTEWYSAFGKSAGFISGYLFLMYGCLVIFPPPAVPLLNSTFSSSNKASIFS